MELQEIIIHELIKHEHSTGASLFLTDTLLDVSNEKIKRIVTSLDGAFSRKTIRRAKFSEDGFSEVIEDFENFDLVSESRSLAQKLKDLISGISAAKGGYLVFCRYLSTRNFFSVYLVRNTTGSLLKPKEGSADWDVESSDYLDVDHFAMGVRINLDTLLSDASNDRYVHLIKGNTDISDYFERWVGVDETKMESVDGDSLYKMANEIQLPDGVDRSDFKKKIHDFAKERPSQILNLRDLSTFLYDDPDVIPRFCEEKELDIDGEFRLSGNQLKKFWKVTIVAGGIRLEASRDKFNQRGISVSEDGDKVIIHSPDLAAKISEDVG